MMKKWYRPLSIFLSYTTVWLWRLLVLAVILLAMLVSIGREMAPLLKENKNWLEGHLTAVSGYLVQMESVEAEWEGLAPELKVTRLSISDSITLDRVLMRVDLLRSAFHHTLVFDALTVQGAVLEIPVSTEVADEKINLGAGLNFLFGSANIRLRDVSLRLHRPTGEELFVRIEALDIGNAGERHWTQGVFTVADAKQPVELAGAFTGSATDILAGEGHAYLDFGDGSKLRKVLGFVANQPDLPFSIGTSGGLQGRAWLNWHENELHWTAAVNVRNLDIATIGYRLDYAGNLAGRFVIRNGMLDSFSDKSRYELSVSVPQGELLINQQAYAVPDWGLRYRSRHARFGNESTLSIYLPTFDLSVLDSYRGLMTHATLRQTLAVLQPRGILQNVQLILPLDKTSSFKPLLQANLRQVSVAAWKGAPALAQVDGYLETTAHAGFIEVDSRQGFSMFFPNLYAHSMDYYQMRGRVYWQIDAQSDYVYAGSAGIDLVGKDGKGRAAFWLGIPPHRLNRAGEMYLTVGLKNSAVEHRHKYLPGILPRPLNQWLDTSIKSGKVVENGFIYRGSLGGHDEQERSILYYARLQDGVLQFDPEWPSLSHINMTLLVDNGDVRAEISQAYLRDLVFGEAVVEVKSGSFLTIQGEVKGKGDHTLDLLRKTPLRKTLGTIFDQWQLEGNIDGRVSLGISLDKKQREQKEFQEVAIKLNQNNLHLRNISLSLDHLTGDLYYSSALGLSAPQLSARLWDHPQTISIAPVEDQDALPDILISTTGDVEPAQLAEWGRLPFIRFLQGSIPVQGKLEIPLDANAGDTGKPFAKLAFFSDLQGVELDLPAPLNKPADSTQPMVVNVDLLEDRQQYEVIYGSLASAHIQVPLQGALQGQVLINQEPASSVELLADGLEVRGHLDKAVLEDWLKVIDRYGKLEADQAAKRGPASEGETPSPVFYFALDDFQIGEHALGNTILTVSRLEDKAVADNSCWQAGFEHAAATGYYRYFDKAARLPELTFDRLNLDEWQRLQGYEEPLAVDAEAAQEQRDPLAEVVPQDLPALQVQARQVIHEGNKIGDWRFTIQPQPWGAAFNNFSATMPGLSIDGMKNDRNATVLWRREGDMMQSEISSRIRISNRDGVKNLFGIDRIIEAEKTELQGTVRWSGSPANMQFTELVGDMSIHSEKGRFLNSTASTDLMRVINVFNFNTWARRLKLDFTDLYKKGVSYDRVDGHIQLDRGRVVFDQPLVMESPSSQFTLQGTVDSVNNSIEADLAVTLPVSDNAAWITALAGGLPAAVGVWVVSKIFEKQIDNLSSVSYTISGELDDPDIQFKHLLKD